MKALKCVILSLGYVLTSCKRVYKTKILRMKIKIGGLFKTVYKAAAAAVIIIIILLLLLNFSDKL